MSILHFIPDTNLFTQCRPLEELDWSIWAEFDEIHVIVCRPVQREIDNQKTRGNDRVAKRARKTNSLFRRIINSKNGYELIQEAKPQIKLLVDPTYQPSSDLRDQLDYNEIDDQIVRATAHFYTY
ncbi:MAG: PIN domain-containing protein [Gammaproteobacteria bacterium]|nr:PIN domain-containing protein [Gammaproteobacteria bacterium]